jgi:hypothetical protein
VRLVVPYIGELRDLDVRMIRLAEFLGISCETLALQNVTGCAVFLEESVPDRTSCLVVNPGVIREWVGSDGIPAELVGCLLSRFRHLLVHGLRATAFDTEIVAALSRGRLKSVEAIKGGSQFYVFAKDSKHVCEAFAGLSFGPVNPVNDHVFCTSGSDSSVEKLISIDGKPFMTAVRLEGAEILFLASEDVVDLNAAAGGAPLTDYFSRLVPHAMALRYAAGDECWRPKKAYASIIIDDPLLQKSYGFLNFESLLNLADKHNFHATIAFIPHNFRRNSFRITRMFKENAERLSICFHGNDHTRGEFASTDMGLLNTLVRVAENRMTLHRKMTGLHCDKVMVFPQENFSIEAMKVLKSHNFYAAVNRVPHPAEQPVRLTIGELAQPAVLKNEGCPFFIRNSILKTENQDIAFNLFFGRPILIAEHHDIFQHPQSLVEIAARINSLASEVHWSGLATAVSNSILTRREADGTYQIRAYSGTVRISNDSDFIRRYSIGWSDSCNAASIEQVLMDGMPCSGFSVDDAGLRLSVEIAPQSSHEFFLVYRNAHANVQDLDISWNARAFLRRRLSAIRDNYFSKNQRLLTIAKALQRRFLRV